MKPQIAIITRNTLEAIGLDSIVRKMMPRANVRIFSSFSVLEQSADFFHYFISSETLLSHAQFFFRCKAFILLMCSSRRMYFCAIFSKWHKLDINIGRNLCWWLKAKCSVSRRLHRARRRCFVWWSLVYLIRKLLIA